MRLVLNLMTANAVHFLPGEAHDEMKRAWDEASPSFDVMLDAILRTRKIKTETGESVSLSDRVLSANHLTENVGAAKLSALRRWKERFLRFCATLPAQDVAKTPAVEAGLEYLELATNIAGSIPGAGPIKELLGLYKQQLKFRLVSAHG
jgi:hypothetical protein